MGKKVKPSSLLDADPVAEAKRQEEFKQKSLVGNGQMTAESRERLQNYEAMEKSLASLSEEKSILEAKVAEYAEKLAAIDPESSRLVQLESDNKALEEKVQKIEAEAADTRSLEDKVAKLESSNESYLQRISELTFQNAVLAAQVEELSKGNQKSSTVQNQSQFSYGGSPRPIQNGLSQPHRDAYNPYINNGYASW